MAGRLLFQLALFCTFLTTAWPQPRAVRSIRGEPGSAANRQAFASPCCLAFPQGLHDPHLRRVGFRVSKTTHAACRLPAWAARGPAYYSELPKTLRSVPTYSVYDRIVRLLRAPLEPALLLMAQARSPGGYSFRRSFKMRRTAFTGKST